MNYDDRRILDAIDYRQMQERIEELEAGCDKWCEATIKGLVNERDAARTLADQLAASNCIHQRVVPGCPRCEALAAYEARDWK